MAPTTRIVLKSSVTAARATCRVARIPHAFADACAAEAAPPPGKSAGIQRRESPWPAPARAQLFNITDPLKCDLPTFPTCRTEPSVAQEIELMNYSTATNCGTASAAAAPHRRRYCSSPSAMHAAVMTYPGLLLQFTEVSGGPTPYTFLPASPQMTAQLRPCMAGATISRAYRVTCHRHRLSVPTPSGRSNLTPTHVGSVPRPFSRAGRQTTRTERRSCCRRTTCLGTVNISGLWSADDGAIDYLRQRQWDRQHHIPGSENLAVDPDTPVPGHIYHHWVTPLGVNSRMRITVGSEQDSDTGTHHGIAFGDLSA